MWLIKPCLRARAKRSDQRASRPPLVRDPPQASDKSSVVLSSDGVSRSADAIVEVAAT